MHPDDLPRYHIGKRAIYGALNPTDVARTLSMQVVIWLVEVYHWFCLHAWSFYAVGNLVLSIGVV